jgi:AraC-like DNA-binding protein/mannose-6-phosphate isomerase-like protein (cupin superfamily)
MFGEPLDRYIADELLHHTAAVSSAQQHVREIDVHWHDFYELVFVSAGDALHQVNGSWTDVRAGSAFLLTPADFHKITAISATPLTCYNVVVDPWLLEERLSSIDRSMTESTWTLHSASDLEDDFRRLHEEGTRKERGSTAMMEAILQCILIECSRRRGLERGASTEERPHADRVDMTRAVLFIDHHFREPLTLSDVASRAHLSPNYFSERFRKFTGMSFQVYLQRRRLHFARSLLTATTLGVTHACHAAGFNDLSHFGRAYRRRYGESPSATRSESLTTEG